MLKTTKLIFALLVVSNFVVFSQEIKSGATTIEESFTTSTGTNATALNDITDWTTSGSASASYKFNQTLIQNNGTNTYSRLAVKAQFRHHQWNTPIKGEVGDIITLKMKFRTNSAHTGYQTGADGDLFSFGLKSVLDASDTVGIVGGTDVATRNGETATINIADADGNGTEMLNVRYKTYTNANAAYDTNDWKYVTMKYFIGSSMEKSKIVVKLDNTTASSGWLNVAWSSQLLYDAITDPAGGAYTIFSSGKALGTSGSSNHLWIDSYEFTTSGDTGIAFISGGYAADGSWSTGLAPTASDRVFIMNTSPNLNNPNGNFDADYMYISPYSKLTVTNVSSLVVPTLDVDGQIDVIGANFKEGTIKIGTSSSTNFDSLITLDDTADKLTVAPSGYLLEQSTYYFRWYSGGTKWTTYDGTNWNTIDTTFPLEASDYSSNNLFLSSSNTTSELGLEGTFTFKNISVIADKKLRISANAKITVTNLNNYGLAIDAFNNSSLIVNGTATGDLKYNKYLGTTNWYLLSPPVGGQVYNDAFVTDNSIDPGTGTNRAIGTYTTSNDQWSYMQGGDYDATFNQGNGYAIKRNAVGSVAFSGSIKTTDLEIALVASGNGFRLIGNPYLSPINSASILARSENALETKTIWIWDQSANSGAGSYLTKVEADNWNIAQAQGFFVQADTDAGNVLMEATDRTQTNSGFKRTTARPEIYLNLSDGVTSREAKIYYIEGTTTGFDNGYDGPMFGGVANKFAIYSHSVSNGYGRDLAVQSLPDNNYENMVIPIGVNAVSGTEINISATTKNFPSGINIYLEDKEDNSFTLLDTSSNLTKNLSTDLNGIGRFYLHTTSGVLNTDNVALNNNISIYTSNRENLRIVGVQNGTTKVRLYNVLGKQLLNTSFVGNGVNNIALPNFNRGAYIVQLETESGIVNKKIILE